MARPFNAAEAKKIIERHNKIIEKLNCAEASVEKYRERVKDFALCFERFMVPDSIFTIRIGLNEIINKMVRVFLTSEKSRYMIELFM